MGKSRIEWTGETWNPVTGCSKVSQGCKFCYAEVMTKRLKAMGQEKYKNGFDKVETHETALSKPYEWRTPRIVFVNSMSDLFHKDVPLDFIQRVFKVMNENPRHTFQILTKRGEKLVEVHERLRWTSNIWMGVSIENEAVSNRIGQLAQTGAKVRFLSLEPLIGPLPGLDLTHIDWVIVGGESGRRPRPMQKEWVVEIRDQCRRASVPFFFKQWGGKNKKVAGRRLEGTTYDEMPAITG